MVLQHFFLALTIMHDFPGAVRSVILDLPLPVQLDWRVNLGPDLQAALDLFLESCAAAFVDDPAAPLDLACVEALQRQPPAFVTN